MTYEWNVKGLVRVRTELLNLFVIMGMKFRRGVKKAPNSKILQYGFGEYQASVSASLLKNAKKWTC